VKAKKLFIEAKEGSVELHAGKKMVFRVLQENDGSIIANPG